MAVDPDERFVLPEDIDPDEALRRLLEPDDSESVSEEPEDEEADS
ncbi:MAG TPA: hypothetical protein VIJ56_06565 [Acidimicrobiales bacterium]